MSRQSAPRFGEKDMPHQNTWKDLVLEARSLACERGGRLIFKGLDFKIQSGEAVELRGPNGAGKSSLLRLLAGLNKPAGGSLELSAAVEDIGTMAHYIGHNEAAKPALTIHENLDFWSRFLGGKADLAPLKLQRLAHDEARFLSEGQRRRLALSRLVSIKRPLWLLDEPTVGLDQTALADLRGIIQSHLSEGGMVIAATHADLGLPKMRVLQMQGRD